MSNNSNEPIRVAQIIGKWVGGGVEAVVMNYYRHIDKSKIQFDFICDDDSTNIPYEEIESLGGKVILIPPYQKVFKYHKQLKRVLKEGKYKIVNSHINTLSVFSLFAAKCAKVPVRIAHSHSTIINNKRELKRNILKSILKHFSKVFATNYCACSNSAAISQFGKKTYNNQKVNIIYNAIDIEKFKYNKKYRNEIRNELKIEDSSILIGHVGRFVETKNQLFIIDIFANYFCENKNSYLVFAGQGPMQEAVKEKVKKLKLQDNVFFLGQRKDIYKIYDAIDCFVFPSLYEGLGMSLIEAEMSGLNCIASTSVPIEAKVNDKVNFVDLNDDISEWTKHIKKSENRENFLSEKIQINYNIERQSKILENYYFKLINKD